MKEFTAQGHYIFQRNRTANVGKFTSDLEASHAAACLNACHNVPDPEVTIPALVEALDTLVKVEFGSLKGAQQWNKQHNGSGYWPRIIDILSKLNPSDT